MYMPSRSSAPASSAPSRSRAPASSAPSRSRAPASSAPSRSNAPASSPSVTTFTKLPPDTYNVIGGFLPIDNLDALRGASKGLRRNVSERNNRVAASKIAAALKGRDYRHIWRSPQAMKEWNHMKTLLRQRKLSVPDFTSWLNQRTYGWDEEQKRAFVTDKAGKLSNKYRSLEPPFSPSRPRSRSPPRSRSRSPSFSFS